MANLVETPTYDAGIYQLETRDPVVGGPTGIDNKQGIALGNRTAWLKQKVDALLAAGGSAADITAAINAHLAATDPHAQYTTNAEVAALITAAIASRSNKSVLINGNFNIWQRGNTFIGGYTADKWLAIGVASVDKNESGSPTGSSYNMLINRSIAGAATIAQRIEGYNAVVLQNAQAALSLYYGFVSGDVSSIDVSLSYANVKDDFSLVTLIENINISSPTSGMKLEAIFAALPAAVSNGLLLNITFNTVAGCQVRLAQVQLEKGNNVTAFEYMDVSRELAMCQRYYEIVTANTFICTTSASNTGISGGSYSFKATKRVSPSIAADITIGGINGDQTLKTNRSALGDESGLRSFNYVSLDEFIVGRPITNTTAIKVDAEL